MTAVTHHKNKGRAIRRGLITLGSLGLCVAGAGMMVQGAAVPVTAHVGQQNLEQQFEQRLAELSPAPARPVKLTSSEAQGAASKPSRSSAEQPETVVALPQQGPIARLRVERLGVEQIVIAPDEELEDQLRRAPVMIHRSEGDRPVSVMAAHRDTHFLFIRDLQIGDRVSVEWVNGKVEQYQLTSLETVRWDQFAYPADPAQPLLALSTCFPFGGTEYGGPWRRVAWAERVT